MIDRYSTLIAASQSIQIQKIRFAIALYQF